jgi:hypothetical protein
VPDVAIEVLDGTTVIESVVVPDAQLLEVPTEVPGAYIEVLVEGPQGAPGDTRFYVGNTPPADTSMIWVDTSA